MTAGRDYEIFEAGDVTLRSGAVVPSLKLAYKTYGTLGRTRTMSFSIRPRSARSTPTPSG